MPTTARRSRRNPTGGPWGAGLLCVGLALTAQGIAYMAAKPDELRTALSWINAAVPIAGWGLLWVGAGVYSVWTALRPPQRHGDLIPAVAVISLWAAFYGAYWLYTGLIRDCWTRDWTASLAWGSLAAVLICFGRCNNPPTGRSGR